VFSERHSRIRPSLVDVRRIFRRTQKRRFVVVRPALRQNLIPLRETNVVPTHVHQLSRRMGARERARNEEHPTARLQWVAELVAHESTEPPATRGESPFAALQPSLQSQQIPLVARETRARARRRWAASVDSQARPVRASNEPAPGRQSSADADPRN